MGADYILGTHRDELERLRFQHELWRPICQAAWDRAGFAAGQRVLDLGAGPGFAALDLARLVGPRGRVLALERSGDYVAWGQGLKAGVAVAGDQLHGAPSRQGMATRASRRCQRPRSSTTRSLRPTRSKAWAMASGCST